MAIIITSKLATLLALPSPTHQLTDFIFLQPFRCSLVTRKPLTPSIVFPFVTIITFISIVPLPTTTFASAFPLPATTPIFIFPPPATFEVEVTFVSQSFVVSLIKTISLFLVYLAISSTPSLLVTFSFLSLVAFEHLFPIVFELPYLIVSSSPSLTLSTFPFHVNVTSPSHANVTFPFLVPFIFVTIFPFLIASKFGATTRPNSLVRHQYLELGC